MVIYDYSNLFMGGITMKRRAKSFMYIADIGRSYDLKSGNGEDMYIPRYAVYQVEGKRSHIVELSDDVELLMEKHSLNKEDVIDFTFGRGGE